MANKADDTRHRLRTRLLLGGVALLALWLGFFDSHSIYRRVSWHQESSHLRAENEELVAEIEFLEEKVRQGLSDEVVERIAREQYGMRRPGETVHRIESR